MKLELKTPQVADRTDISLQLTCRRKGRVIWTDTKQLSILNAVGAPVMAGKIAVWDPDCGALAHLLARGANVTHIDRPEALPADVQVLMIGRNALSARQSTDPMWLSMVRQGKRLVVLEQERVIFLVNC